LVKVPLCHFKASIPQLWDPQFESRIHVVSLNKECIRYIPQVCVSLWSGKMSAMLGFWEIFHRHQILYGQDLTWIDANLKSNVYVKAKGQYNYNLVKLRIHLCCWPNTFIAEVFVCHKINHNSVAVKIKSDTSWCVLRNYFVNFSLEIILHVDSKLCNTIQFWTDINLYMVIHDKTWPRSGAVEYWSTNIVVLLKEVVRQQTHIE